MAKGEKQNWSEWFLEELGAKEADLKTGRPAPKGTPDYTEDPNSSER